MATAEDLHGAAGARTTRSRLPVSTGTVALRSLKTSETVARDLVHDIITQGLQPGDRLPPEAEMLGTFGVSRESLREGLRLLEVQGLITIRRGPGGGPVVGSVDPGNLGRSSSLYYHLVGATYAELFDAWVLVESLLAGLAARHPDRLAVKERMGPYVVSGPETGRDRSDHQGADPYDPLQPGMEFHADVASLAGNRILQLLLSTIGQIVTHHHVAVVGAPRDVVENLEIDHSMIARAIRAGHSTKAHELMERHISAIVENYTRRMGPLVDDYVEWQ